jgi:DNA sulfur modification protein DndB
MSSRLFLPALQGAFGDWTYYVVLIELSELVERVGYARQLQANEKLSQLIQRRLDEEKRAVEIAEYLLSTTDRFFNSLVVGVHGGEPAWHPFSLSAGRVDHDLGDIVRSSQDLVGYLELRGDEALFALDGQHRLAGIKQALATDPNLGSEKVSVIMVAHQATRQGVMRTRGLFISLNKKAVPVSRKDIIVLDEVDLPAIVTRQLIDDHPWFSRAQVDFERFGSSLPATSPCWTTLGSFYDLNARVIQDVVAGRDADELEHGKRNRLPEERIAFYRDGVVDFYERLFEVDPLLRDALAGRGTVAAVRQARSAEEPHLLFRPVGMKIIGRVAAELRRSADVGETFRQLRRVPRLLSSSPFSLTIWDGDRGRMNTRGEALATRLLLYMLGARPADDNLRRSFADFTGRPVEGLRLPSKLP